MRDDGKLVEYIEHMAKIMGCILLAFIFVCGGIIVACGLLAATITAVDWLIGLVGSYMGAIE